MKVLWITNILFPEADSLLTGNSVLRGTGGWMLASSQELTKKKDVVLAVATVSNKVKKLTKLEGKVIHYYILPIGKGNSIINNDYQPLWKKVKSDFQPDVVHIHGTEYSHGYAYVKACGDGNVIVSIQGLVSVISQYYRANLSCFDILKNVTLYDLYRGNIISKQKTLKKMGKYERELLASVYHVIGRTTWDQSHLWEINPRAKYHFCNETLRTEFYKGEVWNYENCNKHSIFISQSLYPLKGLHQVLKAMPIILKHYPDAKIRVAGKNIVRSSEFKDYFRLSGYGLYIKRLIHKLRLDDVVIFTGNLDAEDMKNEYLKSNVFICPSSIENSPNSLAEAQILGVPCISSYVGGVPDMMIGNEKNMYRFEEIEMLARIVCRVFNSKVNESPMIDIAKKRHSPEINSNALLQIYRSIIIS